MGIITKGMGKILKKEIKSFKDKRIDAINRKGQGNVEPYIEEYDKILKSKAKNKKEFKKGK